jgi:cobalt/nickel transport system permease protein
MKATSRLNDLEEMANGKSVIHTFHPLSKIIITFVFLVVVISFDRYQISGLIPFILYPVIMLSLSLTPLKPIFYRLIPALPFSLFGGFSNIIFDRLPVLVVGMITITSGMISFVSILLKTVLTVTAVLILIATTPMPMISKQLTRIGIPSLIVFLLIMTYRYISVLIEEVSTMVTAYTVRAPRQKYVKMKDMGSFIGHLLLRSMDRAERVFAAMKCRGFNGTYATPPIPKETMKDVLLTISVCTLFITCRFVNISMLLGNFLTGNI